MSVYLNDLLDLPATVNKGDFVLKLAEGVERADETLRNYVVTPQLQRCFDEALSLIQNAIAGNSSKACHLHGSFGSGKSHFMAVLNLILAGNTQARSIEELAGTVSKHNAWSQGKKFMMVPYHMIGKDTMESAILGGYVEHVSTLDPEGDVPPVFTSTTIFADAVKIREDMGDDTFFKRLNAGSGSGGGKWGKMAAAWTPQTFEEAIDSRPQFDENKTYRVTGSKARLQSALIKAFFSAVKVSGQYVDLDEGLEVISQHAKSLGYDAVILFLDELILWLASNAADQRFLAREGQKISKLVEAEHMDRPVPLVSFVARQRDLRELVGDHVSGSDKTRFTFVADYWEGRFSTITLEDRNLPAIAEKRVLKPKSMEARKQIDAAFEKATRMKDEVLKVLLTSAWDKGMFRKIYPFSPAFMEMLVEMSFMLQRDRTALKVMLKILIDRRDTLTVGEIIPVGDLFDAISQGDEAISEDVKRCFANALRLYDEKLCPLLEAEHQMAISELETLPYHDRKAAALRNDDRLMKTLLLAALAPKLESFQGLTASRLAALNHGTIRSPIPNQEAVQVIKRCKKWAAQVGQIKIGDDPKNPTVAIQLTGIDTESILLKADTEDNAGNRIRKIKEILFTQFQIKRTDELMISHSVEWRGTKRSCEVVFGNVREMSLSALENKASDWRVVVDWPFDDGHSPADDFARLQQFRSEISEGARTIVILPSFLSAVARKDLGMLVKLDHVLMDTRFSSYAAELSPGDQQVARSLLQNQRSQLQQRMVTYLESAYGVGAPVRDALDTTHEFEERSEHYRSLDNDLTLQAPAAPTLERLFDDLLHQALKHQFPAHPAFGQSAKLTRHGLTKIYEECRKAAEAADGRLAIEKAMRAQMTDVAVPLELGKMGEAHFVLDRYWVDHFSKKETEDGGEVTVEKVRAWLDEPKARGLPRDVQDLVLMVFAAQDNRSFWHLGRTITPEVGRLSDEYVLKEVALAPEEDWTAALDRAARLLGLSLPSTTRNAHSLGKLEAAVQAYVERSKSSVDQYYEVLKSATGMLCPTSKRMVTAEAARSLVSTLHGATAANVVQRLLDWQNVSTDDAVGNALTRSAMLLDTVKSIPWGELDLLNGLKDSYAERAADLKAGLVEALQVDEYVSPLAAAIESFEQEATALLKDALQASPPPTRPDPEKTPPTPPEPAPPSRGRGSVVIGLSELDRLATRIREEAERAGGTTVRVSWEIAE